MRKILMLSMMGILILIYWKLSDTRPVLLTVDYQALLKVKEKIQEQDPYYYSYYQKLIDDAEKYLNPTLLSGVDKTAIFSTDDPYGYSNYSIDSVSEEVIDSSFVTAAGQVRILILAGFFSEQEKYSRQAARLLDNLFFSDENQWHQNHKRPATVAEVRQLICLLEVYPLLQETSAWSDNDHKKMTAWAQQYLDHLSQLEHGMLKDSTCTNGHTWYEAQVAVLAYVTHHEGQARQAVQRAKMLIGRQIEPDGKQTCKQDSRLSYPCSLFNLQAFYMLSSVGERLGEDLWDYVTADGRSLQKASDFVFHSFLHQGDCQMTLQHEGDLLSLLLKAQRVYKLPEYEQLRERLMRQVPGYWPVLLYDEKDYTGIHE